MIIDKELIFSDDQAVTASTASTNDIETGAAGVGNDEAWLYVKSTAAFNTLTSLDIALLHSDDGFSSDSDVALSKSVDLADLTADTVQLRVRLPKGLKKDLRMFYTVTGTNPTTGSMYAAIVSDVDASF